MAWETTLISRAGKAFRAAADPDRALPMKAYMRDQFEYFGIMSGPRDVLIRAALADMVEPSIEELSALARACWKKPEREWQYLALQVVRKNLARLPEGFLPIVREMIATKSWWDTVDDLAVHVVGGMVARHPALALEMDLWAKSPELWIARTAILHQNRYKTETDRARLFAYCAHNAAGKNFFTRKAIGWALRAYAATEPEAVRDFVESHALSPLSKKEAMRGVERALNAKPRPKRSPRSPSDRTKTTSARR